MRSWRPQIQILWSVLGPVSFLCPKSHLEGAPWIRFELLGAKGMDTDFGGDMDVCRDMDVGGIWAGTRKQDELKPGHLQRV